MPKLLLATAAELPDLAPDCRALVPALEACGWEVTIAVWDDPTVAWHDADAVVVRSIWDYYTKRQAFEAWLRLLEAGGVPVANPVGVIRHNLDKRYLGQLERDGIDIVPTLYTAGPNSVNSSVNSGANGDVLDDVLSRGWREVVIKPTINAAGFNTHRVDTADVEAFDTALDAARAGGEVMVQRFVPAILTDGEWSLILFDGEYSHAVRKRAADGEFRVQDDHGGTVHIEEPPAAAMRSVADVAASAARLAGADGSLPYARIDGVVEGDRFLVMEAELIEPELFLRADPNAPARCAAALTRYLT